MWMCGYQPQITYWNLYAARVHLHSHVIQVDVDVWIPAPDQITYWNLYAAHVHLHSHVIQADVDV